MDEHDDDLPPTMASSGADQTQKASAAASSGAAMDLPLMEPAAAASSGAGGHGFRRLFDGQLLQDLVTQRDWANLEKQLKILVSAVDVHGDPEKLHPSLFIIVYQEWIVDHIKKKEHGAALKMFIDKVSILYEVEGAFINRSDLKLQINRLHKIANAKAKAKATPVKAIQDRLSDYIYLYFADFYGPEKQAGCHSHLWRFAKMIGKPPGQEDPSFRCLACRTTFRNCPISKMRDHLDTRTSGGTCPKLTIYMQVCFNEGETQKGNTVPKHHGSDGRSTPSRHAKVGKTGKQNIAIQDKLPAAEGRPENFLVTKLVEAIHATAWGLHMVSAGKPLEPKVEEKLRAARDLLGEVLVSDSADDDEEEEEFTSGSTGAPPDAELVSGTFPDGQGRSRFRRSKKQNPRYYGPAWHSK
ncbi:uncharacterized protein LOC110436590 [Sorghum bicolor]|uniref:Uncharacterized protein n=1 Tax=Sorghum bicolor TaxID=4558 RepID=A0A1B6PN83_SORBI|nr:uncharacterized protein LOC110436590 [Sorghum bicolor]KXG27119.1 hypothetical protein SORBI_3006G216100 [Sorghum bicolor]|eukprot:XP_021319636.1 uncharacterized protein LOC110436590 [Sorghum bicolor]